MNGLGIFSTSQLRWYMLATDYSWASRDAGIDVISTKHAAGCIVRVLRVDLRMDVVHDEHTGGLGIEETRVATHVKRTAN